MAFVFKTKVLFIVIEIRGLSFGMKTVFHTKTISSCIIRLVRSATYEPVVGTKDRALSCVLAVMTLLHITTSSFLIFMRRIGFLVLVLRRPYLPSMSCKFRPFYCFVFVYILCSSKHRSLNGCVQICKHRTTLS